MKKCKIIKSLILGVFIASTIIFLSTPHCSAVKSLVDTSAGSGYSDGEYTLDSVRNYLIYLMGIILSLVGTLSLLAFVYGGITFLLSAGSSDKIKKGIDIIKAAVIGLLITFTSVLIINLFFGGLGIDWNKTTGKVTMPEDRCAKEWGSKGYSCMLVSDSNSGVCENNLCGGNETVKCCKP